MTASQTLFLWLHIVSLALWLGGIGFFLVVLGPAAEVLPPGLGMRVLDGGRRRFQALSWTAITLLVISGIANLIFRAQGAGTQLGQFYLIVLGVKLFLFLAMFFHHSLQVFKYAPKIVALTAQTTDETASWPEPLRSTWTKWFMLLKINAGLGLIVVLLGLGLTKS